nr:hypothetical protein [Tanacetum cinerariifolium]
MALTFADTHNMIAYLTKSNASEGFNQIIDFLDASSIQYALTVNPNIYVSCIKQFWSSVLVKKVNDVIRLQALIHKRKLIITEDIIREALRLNDAKSIDCLPNEEIFTKLERMGYEKPSIKLTFYKAFFSTQWKVGKGFSGVDTPLFEEMLVPQQAADAVDDVVVDSVPTDDVADDVPAADAELNPHHHHLLLHHHHHKNYLPHYKLVENLEQDKIDQALEILKLKKRARKLEMRKKLKASGLQRLKKEIKVEKNAEVEKNADVQERLEESQAKVYHIDLEHADKVLSMQYDEPEPTELQEVIKVVTTAKLMIELVTAATITITVAAPTAARRRKGVVIRDLEETATPSTIVHTKPKSKDKGKGIMVEEQQVKEKGKQDNFVLRYQALKRKPQTKAQARKNIMVYLKNMADFKMDYFKGMSYDDIRPIFKKYFNLNVAFLEKSKEQLEEDESKALKRTSESLKEKAAKKKKLDEEVEELKKHLQIVPNDDVDVYTEATPLALKVPVVDYEIYSKNNKPYYKIIRADGSHQLFLSFLSLLRNFDREDLEMLCSSLEESKRRSWFSKSQKLEIVRVLCSAYHNIYNYIDDLAGREKISIDKVHFRADAEQCKVRS